MATWIFTRHAHGEFGWTRIGEEGLLRSTCSSRKFPTMRDAVADARLNGSAPRDTFYFSSPLAVSQLACIEARPDALLAEAFVQTDDGPLCGSRSS